MWLWMKQRATSRSFQNAFVGGLVAMAVYDLVLTPSTRLLPHAPVILYNVLATALIVLIITGVAVGSWGALKDLRDLFTSESRRRELGARIRKWPSSKWDAVAVFTFAWALAVGTALAAFLVMAPIGHWHVVVSAQQAQAIGLLLMGPLVLIGFIMIGRNNVLLYKDFRHRFASGTGKQRVVLCSSMSFVFAAVFATAIGELAGWSHLLWFYSS